MKHKIWKTLLPNDIVDVISPGYPSPAEEVLGGIHFLESWNLQPRAPKNLQGKHFIHSNEDDIRFSHLAKALLAEDSKVIWCTRGGYGSNRLLPYLAKLKKPKQCKLLVGLSDITSLHCFLTQVWGWPTLHASVLDRMGRGTVPKSQQKELKDILFGKADFLKFEKLKALNAKAASTKKIKSSVVGGNLTVLQSTLGTPFQIDLKNKLLFIEDLGERGYRIDRMLEQFRQAGLFKNCQGILLGQFLGGVEPATGKDNFNKVFARWAKDLEIPLWSGIECGHGDIQRPIPFNTEAELLHSDNKFKLTIQTHGVSEK